MLLFPFQRWRAGRFRIRCEMGFGVAKMLIIYPKHQDKSPETL